MLAAPEALAHPTVYPAKPALFSQVVTSDQVTSKFLMDHHDETLFYVLPPAFGHAYASSFSMANTNLGFCEDMVNIQTAGHGISGRLKRISEDQDTIQSEISSQTQALVNAQSRLNELKASNGIAAQIILVDQSLALNQARLDALYTGTESCIDDCSEIAVEIKMLQDANLTFENSKQSLIRENLATANEVGRLLNEIQVQHAQILAAQNRYASLDTQKISLLMSLKELFSTYAHLEGGTASFRYDSGWSHQVELLNRLNPGKKFITINAYKAEINASALGADANSLDTLPAFLSSTIDGRTNGNGALLVGAFPEQFTETVRLSLAGACPKIHPSDFQVKLFEPGKIDLAVSIKYAFDVASNTKIDCAYDEKEVYLKILTSGSTGALFWKKNWSTLDLNNIKNSTFLCKWDGQQMNQTTFAERRKLEADALNYAISQMLSQYAKPNDLEVNAPLASHSGMTEVGEGLQRLCGASSVYCLAGSWILKSFDTIFGHGPSTGSGSFHKESTVHLVWDENLLAPIEGQIDFDTDR